ncbi:acetamidase/formamidase family protein [Gottschalkiaceae bacterium SANA]|nr:acetamidase/formamidase family protein [Gottschalkiaceae bacterium SANA]
MLQIPVTPTLFDFSKDNTPVATAKSGDTVAFDTLDCYGNAAPGCTLPLPKEGGNPATGPLFIEDAMPGDSLQVEILDIEVAKEGLMRSGPNKGVLGDRFTQEFVKRIPIENGLALFDEKLHLPIDPMIGVIGTAPANESIPAVTPDTHGGNMDCKEIKKGTTLFLPVFVEGGLLAMGDLHAVMGDGEVVICGLEVPGRVTVRVTVRKDHTITQPMLQAETQWMNIVSAPTLDEAAQLATDHMHEFLMNHTELTAENAGMLLSLAGNLRICQIVDPNMTVRMEFPLSIMKTYGFIPWQC